MWHVASCSKFADVFASGLGVPSSEPWISLSANHPKTLDVESRNVLTFARSAAFGRLAQALRPPEKQNLMFHEAAQLESPQVSSLKTCAPH